MEYCGKWVQLWPQKCSQNTAKTCPSNTFTLYHRTHVHYILTNIPDCERSVDYNFVQILSKFFFWFCSTLHNNFSFLGWKISECCTETIFLWHNEDELPMKMGAQVHHLIIWFLLSTFSQPGRYLLKHYKLSWNLARSDIQQ